MLAKALSIAALALAVGAPLASGEVSVADGSDPAPYVALLGGSYMPLPETFTIVPSPGGCPGQVPPGYTRPAACADSNMKLYVDPSRVLDPSSNGRMVMTHETGHIVDFTIRASDGGATDRAFDTLMTDAGVVGSRLEQFADVWAECSLEGPTADPYVTTPSYTFQVPSDAYSEACDLIRSASTSGFASAPKTYAGAPWRKIPQVGDCMTDGGYVVTCPDPSLPIWIDGKPKHHKKRYPHKSVKKNLYRRTR